jgi:hypothetical protein
MKAAASFTEMAPDNTIEATQSPRFESLTRETSERSHAEFSLPEHFHRVRSKTVVSFSPGDPENPLNWSQVSTFDCQKRKPK